ncbi:TIGR04452 family lipoprotein [Leptospira kmetyi]|uniref:TIGR04452 family lipoprotein n=1 Tax=Leptospira kmetyi TaxID=408139 RepID=UPI001082BAD8|nr:TIGR04452 family lipoprotein [Leptospira kmetyi]TGK19499.1 TIGR04452 family lipoprotein [Leptospira kmetyi]TGK26440.1 TIGR04452 family lipoprotein [Leptospira kmetyi]TGL70291.1 TIGR04452 family lipoprotein [Leptospira kmetyi]
MRFSLKTGRTFFFFVLFGCNCAYVNINPSLITGVEAKQIISDRLLLSQLVYIMALNEPEPLHSSAVAGLTLTILIPDGLGIDEKKMYQKDAVNECADQIFLVSLVSTGLTTFVCKASNPPISIPVISRKL